MKNPKAEDQLFFFLIKIIKFILDILVFYPKYSRNSNYSAMQKETILKLDKGFKENFLKIC